jgi:hypothetical protein
LISEPVYTEDKLEYTFFELFRYSIDIRVKASHDAHIALSSKAGDDENLVEIFLGGWDNSKSAIRLQKTQPDVAQSSTPQLLADGEWKAFTVEWNTDGYIAVYQKDSAEPFLSWKNPDPFHIKYFGIRTYWGANGNWTIDGRS